MWKRCFAKETAMNRSTLKHHLPVLALVAIALIVCFTPTIGAAPSHTTAPDFAAIDAYIAQQIAAQRIPGLALGIVQGEQVVHLKGFGLADPAGRPVTPQTPFVL